jgi:DNA uptake protein ComE-like DNA-binding protein
LYYFIDFSSPQIEINDTQLQLFRKEVDSLKLVEQENNTPKLYPFNPNYISDYKGYSLGMSNEEIDRLLNYRANNLWINSVQEFQEVTKISDSLLNEISPYFKFPEWVTNPLPKKEFNTSSNPSKTFAQKQDLNTVTALQLQKINGIGETLSERIIKYRTKVGGFISDIQLQEVYGLSPEVIEKLMYEFTVKSPKQIEKINLNTASRDQLVTIQYIDYEVAYNIIEQRTLREGFKSLEELTKVKDFPINKLEIIKLYLTLD